MRLGKSFRDLEVFHVLVASLTGCTTVLLWASVILLLLMICIATTMMIAVEPYVRNSDIHMDERLTAFSYFGTFTRSMLTIFELTLGNWVPATRYLVDEVSEWFSPCMMMYRAVVGEAVVRIMTGVLICETFKVANSDDEMMIIQRERLLRNHAQKMTALFEEADKSGDGFLSFDEFQQAVDDARVRSWLRAMDIEVRDVEMVFALLDDGDRKLSAEEVVRGFAKMKGPAQSVDMMILLFRVYRIEKLLNRVCVHFDVLPLRGSA